MRLELHELYAPREEPEGDTFRTVCAGIATLVFIVGGFMAGMVF